MSRMGFSPNESYVEKVPARNLFRGSSARGDLELADRFRTHHTGTDAPTCMEARQATRGLRIGIAQQRERDPVVDSKAAEEVAEHQWERVAPDVRHVHRLHDRAAKERLGLTGRNSGLPEIFLLTGFHLPQRR